MKIKEAFSKEFKKDDTVEKNISKSKTLREEGDLVLLEEIKREDYLPYSKYLLYNKKYNVSYLRIIIPDPKKKDIYKDIFLKYQTGARRFLQDLFDVLVTGEKEDIKPMYQTKQERDLIIETAEDPFVLIKIKGDEHWFGMFDFFDKDTNLELATKFIKYFEGDKVSFKGEKIDFSEEMIIHENNEG